MINNIDSDCSLCLRCGRSIDNDFNGVALLTVIAIIASVLGLQIAAQILCIWLDGRKIHAPGTLVKLPNRTVHVQQSGSGAPAIVLESGIVASSLNWSILQAQLAAFATVYSYDRAGLGWSSATGRQCHICQMADELHQWIEALHIAKPYVLAGHSYAGYILRVYTQRFADEIAGVILIDPLTPEEWTKLGLAQRGQIRRGVWFSRAGAVVSALGVLRFCLWLLRRGNNTVPRRVLGSFGSGAKGTVERIVGELAKLPKRTVRLIRERWGHPKFFLVMAQYIQALPACAAEVSGYEIPAHIPVTVISGAHQTGIRLSEHKAIAEHSQHGRHIIAAKGAHWIHLDQPELIVQAFCDMAAEMNRETVITSH